MCVFCAGTHKIFLFEIYAVDAGLLQCCHISYFFSSFCLFFFRLLFCFFKSAPYTHLTNSTHILSHCRSSYEHFLYNFCWPQQIWNITNQFFIISHSYNSARYSRGPKKHKRRDHINVQWGLRMKMIVHTKIIMCCCGKKVGEWEEGE